MSEFKDKLNGRVYKNEPVEKKGPQQGVLTRILLGSFHISGLCPPKILWDLVSGVFGPTRTESVVLTPATQVVFSANSETGKKPTIQCVQLLRNSVDKAEESEHCKLGQRPITVVGTLNIEKLSPRAGLSFYLLPQKMPNRFRVILNMEEV